MSEFPAPMIIEPTSSAQHSVIVMHGLGASADDFANAPPLLNLPENHNIRFIFPNAPTLPVTCFAKTKVPAWFDIIIIGQLEPEDKVGLEKAASYIHQLITNEMESGIRGENITLMGFSQGAALALTAGLTFSEPLAGIAALSGYMPVLAREALQKSAKSTRVFIAHGSADDVVPFSASQDMKELLEPTHPVTWAPHHEAHTVSLATFKALGQWLLSPEVIA